MKNEHSTLEVVLEGLMKRYSERVPDVKKITRAMISGGIIGDAAEIENDHVAFRTMGVEHLGIRSFEKIFLALGYRKMDYFYFGGKKLDAYWFAPPEPHFPRIFISELRVNDLSETAREIILSYTREVTADPVDQLDLTDGEAIDRFLHQPLWRTPQWADYATLLKESEYAAWVIYNRYYLNHYTISVHNLKDGYNTIPEFNAFLEKTGIRLNDSGGKIKISPDGGLLQSSTVAEMIDARFADGDVHTISGSYVEFAERKVLPQFAHLEPAEIRREHRRDGFETGNADKIFESTFTSQTARVK
ncbi:DUF1338 domain-containing protein [Leadbetterella sp. DM7]|uniref:DUF1338 domain-containing protein n=1 Tax=Leadbetterella sp. DM7 TaxID=3235085 RepID=UPI00349EF43B